MTKAIPHHTAKKALSWIRRAPGKAVDTIKEKLKKEEKEDTSDLPGEYVLPESPRPRMLSDSSTDSEYRADCIYRAEAERSMEILDHDDTRSQSSSMVSSRMSMTLQSMRSRFSPLPLRGPTPVPPSRPLSPHFGPTLAPMSSSSNVPPSDAPQSRFQSSFANRRPFRRFTKQATSAPPVANSSMIRESDKEKSAPPPDIKRGRTMASKKSTSYTSGRF